MSLKKDGMMIILSSPSGAGKTTLANLLSEKLDLQISISYTTRKPRPDEVNSKHYFFVNEKEFNKLIKDKKFLEYAKVFKNYYGTAKDKVLDILESGKDIIFDIDWQGTEKIKNQNLKYEIISFFVLPPTREVLFKRLSNRDMKDKLIAEERMKQFDKDILHWKKYDYVIINDNLNRCVNELNEVISKKKKLIKSNQDRKNIEKHIKSLLN